MYSQFYSFKKNWNLKYPIKKEKTMLKARIKSVLKLVFFLHSNYPCMSMLKCSVDCGVYWMTKVSIITVCELKKLGAQCAFFLTHKKLPFNSAKAPMECCSSFLFLLSFGWEIWPQTCLCVCVIFVLATKLWRSLFSCTSMQIILWIFVVSLCCLTFYLFIYPLSLPIGSSHKYKTRIVRF